MKRSMTIRLSSSISRAKIILDVAPTTDFVPGRIVMNRQQLVLVGGGETLRISLAAIQDISRGQISETAQEFFDDVIRETFERDGTERVAFIGSANEAMESFAPLLFKAILNGCSVGFLHPSNVG